jgi:hypothetical protein
MPSGMVLKSWQKGPDMNIDLTTPALLFPAISLLLLAYTNRFLTLATLIRDLHSKYKTNPDEIIFRQIDSLRYRVILIRDMQAFGVASIFFCVLCMFVLYAGWTRLGEVIFGLSLLLMMLSLAWSFREIQVSVDALNLRLSDLAAIQPPPAESKSIIPDRQADASREAGGVRTEKS